MSTFFDIGYHQLIVPYHYFLFLNYQYYLLNQINQKIYELANQKISESNLNEARYNMPDDFDNEKGTIIKDKKIKNIVYHDITITAKSKDSDTCYICTATSEGNESKLALSEEETQTQITGITEVFVDGNLIDNKNKIKNII